MKKWIGILLLLAMVLSLAGCADKGQAGASGGKGAQTETVYVSAPLMRAGDFGGDSKRLAPVTISGKYMYTVLTDYSAGVQTLYRMALNTNIYEELGSLDMALDAFLCTAGGDGSLWFFGSSRENGGSFLTQLDRDGKVLARKDLSGVNATAVGNMIGFLSDGKGRLYLESLDRGGTVLTALDLSGEPTVRFSLELKEGRGLTSLARTGDGNLASVNETEKGSLLRLIDCDSGEVSREISLDGVVYDGIFNGTEEYDLFLRAGNKVWGYDVASGSLTEELDLNMAGACVYSQICPDSGGGFILRDTGQDREEIFSVVKNTLPADAVTVLRLAMTGETYSPGRIVIQEAVRRWNKAHAEIKVELVDYGVYNTAAEPDAGSLRLMTELISGSAPDLYELSGMPASFYAKDRFEDLYPYLDADSAVNRGNLHENVLKCAEINGELRQLIPSFVLRSASASNKALAGRQGLSCTEYAQIIQSDPQLERLFTPTIDRENTLYLLASTNLSSLVDWSDGTCHFDGTLFRSLLELAAQQPEQRPEGYDRTQMLIDGRLLLDLSNYLTPSKETVVDLLDKFGPDIRFPGFPCDGGTGSFITPIVALSMSKGSQNKDACWQFIRDCLVGQTWDNGHFSIRRDVNRAVRDDTAAYIARYSGGDISAQAYSRETAEAVPDKLTALIDDAALALPDDKLMDIIQSIAAGYFAGDKSLDDTVADIQARAKIYVAEQLG